MLHSANLNIITRSLEKVSPKLARDFAELENLQGNNFSAVKFANSCYKRIEETLLNELQKIRWEYNFKMSDGRNISQNPDSEYQYTICPIDGLFNLSRSLNEFSSFVSIEFLSPNNQAETVNIAILNVVGNETYSCEKGSGAFVNNRRIRVSKRELKDGLLCSIANPDLFSHSIVKSLQASKAFFQISNCSSLNITKLASGKIDLAIFEKTDEEFLRPFFLLAKEAGGEVMENDGLILVSNGKVRI